MKKQFILCLLAATMKTKIFLTLGIAIILTSCQNSEIPDIEVTNKFSPMSLSASQIQTVNDMNTFGWKLFKEVDESSSNENFVISPFSASVALSILANENSGTSDLILDILGLQDSSLDYLNNTNKYLIDNLQTIDKSSDLILANSAWTNTYDNYRFSDYFISTMGEYYSGHIYNVDRAQMVNLVNDWSSENTAGKISKIIDEPSIYLIAQALYFKSKWACGYKFNPQNTTVGYFYSSDGGISQAQFMSQRNSFNYLDTSLFSYINIPFGNKAFSFNIILPSKDTPINDCVKYIIDNHETFNNLPSIEVNLKMPKFKAFNEIDLDKALCEINNDITKYFQTDFDIKQVSCIEVDEEGAEAAAVTSVSYGSNGAKPIEFVADRPFIYFISEQSSGTILFLGKIAHF